MVKQKDAVIHQLTQDLQSRGTKSVHCNKTESTSRESDDHLRDRETAILKRKNLRLQKLVKKKQKTITNLMQTLQSALGGQTSDGDLLRTEDDADEVDSDAPWDTSNVRSPQRAAAAAASDSGSESEEVPALTRKLNLPEGASGASAGAAV